MIDELADITYSESMVILVNVMEAAIRRVYCLSEEQIELLLHEFYSNLPAHIQDRLKLGKASS